jgi:hypothetical protein
MITLKLTYNHLVVINNAWSYIDNTIDQSRETKVVVSVLKQLAARFQKKAISKANATKPFKMSLAYFEAHFLEKYLIQVRLLDDYNTNLQREIIFMLNQKLT